METLTIKIRNQKALRLIKDLESLDLIQIVSSKVKKTYPGLSETMAGSISREEAETYHQHIQDTNDEWQKLPVAIQQKLSSQSINALLNGELYPTGTEQLDLAIDLAQAGLPIDTISRLTRLLPEAFEAFIQE